MDHTVRHSARNDGPVGETCESSQRTHGAVRHALEFRGGHQKACSRPKACSCDGSFQRKLRAAKGEPAVTEETNGAQPHCKVAPSNHNARQLQLQLVIVDVKPARHCDAKRIVRAVPLELHRHGAPLRADNQLADV